MLRSVVLVLAASASMWACAQTYPAKPVKIIAPTGPGLSTDLVARMLAEKLSRAMGQQVYVENMPGAATIVGAQAGAKAAPDGYTLLMATAGTIVNNPLIYKTLPYDPDKDFAYIAFVGDTSSFMIVVTPELPARSLADLVALEKRKPGSLSYAIEVSSGVSAMIGRYLNKVAGTGMVEVPYKASAQAIQDTITGRTQAYISTWGSMESFIRAGKLRVIASTADRRLPNLPDVPVLAETYPGFALTGFFMLVAPAATPAPLLERINRETVAAASQADFNQRLGSFGMYTNKLGSREATVEALKGEKQRWTRIVKELGMEPQ
jgi:tripartite-type tricarboxylate transporter receptor subunit TctC